MSVTFDPAKIAANLKWLQDHPHFDEKPATIAEFLGEGYLELGSTVRPGIRKALVDIFGAEVNGWRISNYERALVTGGIGIGKTTFASIALPYMAHWVLCLKNPQEFFELMPGSKIAFMQMSTSSKQALEVVFGDIFARIKSSPWFINNYPYDPDYERQIRFPKDIWILPGGSSETQFEGYNILGGILDEMDSHKITDQKDYADVGYDAIHSRIASRFTDFTDPDAAAEGQISHKGLIICIGQMKKSVGFAARKYKEFQTDHRAYTVRMTIWESLGWDRFTRKDGTRVSFWYNAKTKKIIPDAVAAMLNVKEIIEIPSVYRKQFATNPEKALRDLGGYPPIVGAPFISMVDKIEACEDRYIARVGNESPVEPDIHKVKFASWFKSNNDHRKRALHMDFALSEDAFGMAMGYVDHMVEISEGDHESELRPYIVLDCLMRVKARPGQQIQYSEIRQAIYQLTDLGFRIHSITMDGFQSTDTQQQLRKKKFRVSDLSMDKSNWPYEDLREAIYDERIEWPRYMTYINSGDTDLIDVPMQELMQLIDTGKKIDHPPEGSKDVADAMAGVCHNLMGDRTYRKGVQGVTTKIPDLVEPEYKATGTMGTVLQFPGVDGFRTPVPPAAGGSLGLTIPERFRPRH